MSKKKHSGGGGGHGGGASSERWLLTYADLITLLMVFFIVLYSFSQVDQAKYAAIARGLAAAFGGGNLIVPTGMGTGDGVSVPLPKDLETRVAQGDPDAVAEVLEKVGQQLAKDLAADFLGDGRFTVRVAERGLILSLAGSAAFDSGKAEIKPDFVPILDAIADKLRALPNDISVEGFTDSDPIRTSQYASNWELSTARANAVRQYLEAKGVGGERMIVVGYGETRPAFSNATADGKAKNRRVDVVVLTNRQILDLGKELGTSKR